MEMNVVYCSSPSIQQYLPMAIHSLLKHNPQAQVYVLIEGDEDERLKHPNVHIINLKNLTLRMDLSNPNFRKNQIPYTGDVRLYIPEIFPQFSKILYLDVDTIVKGPIDELFSMDMTNMAVAMVKEAKPQSIDGVLYTNYYNSGVLFFNLDYIRQFNLGEKMIDKINGPLLNLPDEDVVNFVCKDHIKELDPKYNSAWCTQKVENPIISHYVWYEKLWQHKDSEEWKKYYVERLNQEK